MRVRAERTKRSGWREERGKVDNDNEEKRREAGDGREMTLELSGRRRDVFLSSLVSVASYSYVGLEDRSALMATAAAVGTNDEKIRVLNNGVHFPSASFGLQVYGDDKAAELTQLAIQTGFRNFFASVLARNQRGFARGVAQSGIARSDIFVCGSVLSNSARGFDSAYTLTKQGIADNIGALGPDIDMLMLDYPGPTNDSIRGQWQAMEEWAADGSDSRKRSIAVSNFSPAQLDCLLDDKAATTIPPTVNQLPLYVGGRTSRAELDANRDRNVLVQAWSPLGGSSPRRTLSSEAKGMCEKIGAAYGKSWAQVALRFIVQSGATFTTQSKSANHFRENLDIFDFELTEGEMMRLEAV